MQEAVILLILILIVWGLTKTEMFQGHPVINAIGETSKNNGNYGSFRKMVPGISPLKFVKMMRDYKEGNLTSVRVEQILRE